MTPTPFDPLRFLRLAEELATDTTDEARLRVAISRAYYAFFLIARDWAGVTGRHDPHLAIARVMNQKGVGGMAGELAKLRRLREAADYDRVVVPDQFVDASWVVNWRRAQRISRYLEREFRDVGAIA